MVSETLVSCPFYTLEKWNLDGTFEYNMEKPFVNVSVIDGEGMVDDIELKKGDHFIIPSTMDECIFRGKMTVMVSYC